MAFIAAAHGRLALPNGGGVVGVTLYELDGTVAVARDTLSVTELPTGTGNYIARATVSGYRRALWAVFDDAAGQFSNPFYVAHSASAIPQMLIG